MNRDQLIAYLLHQMTESERLALAEKWVSDSTLHHELRLVEDELLDAYVRDEVSSEQRLLIEKYLLTSDAQRQKLAFAKALQQALPTRRHSRPTWTVWATAAVAVLASGAAVWLATENATLRRQTPPQIAEPVQGPVLSFFLPSAMVRGSANERVLTLPTDTEVLRLDLEVEGGDAQAVYTATVTQSGAVVWRGEPIRASRRGDATLATLWLPARALNTGRYEIALRTASTDVAFYELRVERP
jgi:hypothetical protein